MSNKADSIKPEPKVKILNSSGDNHSGTEMTDIMEGILPKKRKQGDVPEENFIPSGEIWNKYGDIFKPDTHYEQYKKLPIGVYTVHSTPAGYILRRMYDKYEFDYKVYGLEQNLINRFVKTYNNTEGNLGGLFNGLKGTGKTVTAKQVCNLLELPVILITFNDGSVHNFVNNISQDIVVFVDEYEKIYDKEADMLSIMDGATNSEHRRVFLLTTNSLYINDNLLQRPGRIRYLKTFKDLTPEIIEEIVDDFLIYKDLKKEVIHFISGLESITVDITKSIIQEVNIHEEVPEKFQEIFNVKKLSGKYNIILVNNNSEKHDEKYTTLLSSISTNFKNYDRYNTNNNLDEVFSLSIDNVGYIKLCETADGKEFKAIISSDNLYDKYKDLIKSKLISLGLISKNRKNFECEVNLIVETAWMYNRNYRDYDFY